MWKVHENFLWSHNKDSDYLMSMGGPRVFIMILMFNIDLLIKLGCGGSTRFSRGQDSFNE